MMETRGINWFMNCHNIRQTDIPTDRQTCRPTDRQTDIPTDRQTYRPTYRQTDRQTCRPTDRQTDIPTENTRQTDRHTDRQTDRHRHTTHIPLQDMFLIEWEEANSESLIVRHEYDDFHRHKLLYSAMLFQKIFCSPIV